MTSGCLRGVERFVKRAEGKNCVSNCLVRMTDFENYVIPEIFFKVAADVVGDPGLQVIEPLTLVDINVGIDGYQGSPSHCLGVF